MFELSTVYVIVVVASIAIFGLLLRVAWLSGYQKGIARGRDIAIGAFRELHEKIPV